MPSLVSAVRGARSQAAASGVLREVQIWPATSTYRGGPQGSVGPAVQVEAELSFVVSIGELDGAWQFGGDLTFYPPDTEALPPLGSLVLLPAVRYQGREIALRITSHAHEVNGVVRSRCGAMPFWAPPQAGSENVSGP